MKKVIMMIALLSATASMAADPEYYEAVLKSKALKKALKEVGSPTILGINRTQIYRCLGCYEFEVTVLTDSGEIALKFMTELGFSGSAPNATIQVTRQ